MLSPTELANQLKEICNDPAQFSKAVKFLRVIRTLYYEDGISPLTDDEYDTIEDKLRTIDPNNPLFKKVGSKPSGPWNKIKHEFPMGSLSKAKDTDQWAEWVSKLNPSFSDPNDISNTLVITEKFDGISIAIKYINGKLVQALTRGNGHIGEDITQNVIKMKNIQTELPDKTFTGWLRGEIILLKSDWQKHMPDKKNPRNAAAGTAKRLDGKGCEHLTVQYYEIIDENREFETLTQQYNQLDHWDFTTTMCQIERNPNQIPLIMKIWNENRSNLNYEIDGLVIRISNQDAFESMGITDMRPKGAIAYKFPPEYKETVVISIEWQRGLTGRITPVAELEPVDIGGTTIKRASLHTAQMAIDMRAGPGARVVISRRNDVIPYIERIIEGTEQDINPPSHCPECNVKLRWVGEYLSCLNNECDQNVFNDIKVWTTNIGILHWGDSFIKNIIQLDLVETLQDIYTLNWEIVALELGNGIAKRAKAELNSHRKMNIATFIHGLNVDMCGLSTAKSMEAAGLDTIQKVMQFNRKRLYNVEGIGDVKADVIFTSIKSKKKTMAELAKYITIETKTGPLIGKSFCFTGKMERPRKELAEMAENAGGSVKGSVTKGLTYLVIQDPDSTSKKANKARSLGTVCISEEGFINLANISQ